jgi:transaldolase
MKSLICLGQIVAGHGIKGQVKIKIFADGADLAGIRALRQNPLVKGFTTNPTLMKQSGITDYLGFSKEIVEVIDGLPISLEVFSDDFVEMNRQALKLASLGPNVYVKIPITNTKGDSSAALVKNLAADGVQINVTAMFTIGQVEQTIEALEGGPNSYISIFAGRIADAGIDPIPTMEKALELMRSHPQIDLIWASPREILNVVQGDQIGCHVITVTHDLIKKLTSLGKDLEQFSIETVQMFANDAVQAGFSL